MPPPRTMNVSLTPELAAFVQDRVASGRYGSASEVVRAALRLLEEDERRRHEPAAVSSGAAPGGLAPPPVPPATR
jgi:antitoxin ParD1/3/4